MNEYNDIWTREKFVEYRRLKRSGYSQRELIEHFGDDIYHSGLCNKYDSSQTPLALSMKAKLKKIKEINSDPKKTYYDVSMSPSDVYTDKDDYKLELWSDKGRYILYLMYKEIDNYSTYNVVFTTVDNYKNYRSEKFKTKIDNKGIITEEQKQNLKSILIEDTDIKAIKDIYESFSYVLSNFYTRNLNEEYLSISQIEDEDNLKIYRNIIKDSFPKFKETEVMFNHIKCFIYR